MRRVYYKVRQVLQSVTIITKCDRTNDPKSLCPQNRWAKYLIEYKTNSHPTNNIGPRSGAKCSNIGLFNKIVRQNVQLLENK